MDNSPSIRPPIDSLRSQIYDRERNADQVSNAAQPVINASARIPVATVPINDGVHTSDSTSSTFPSTPLLNTEEKTCSVSSFKENHFVALDTDLANSSAMKASASTVSAQPVVNEFGPKSPMSTSRQAVVFLGVMMVLFLAALDQSIVTTALPSISKDFNNFSDISWVGTGFLLTMTAIQPLYGIAADLAGRRRTMMFANAVFFIGSALCGAAQSMSMLIIGRAVQGIGGSGILTLSLILIADIVPLRNRGKYQSMTAFVYAIASVFGPLVGGAFADNVTWRWAFYINLPVGAVGMVLMIVFLHMNRPKNRPLAAILKGIDYLGIGLLVVAIVMILLGLNWGADAKYAWDSGVILSLLIVGFFLGVVFLFNEWKWATNPIIPLRLLGTLSMGMTYMPVFVDGFVSMGLLFFLPLYSQAVHGASATESGVELLPYVCMSSVVAIIIGQLTGRWGTYKEFIVFGWFAGVLSTGLMVLFDENTSRGRMAGILVVQGTSLGAVVNTQLLAIQAQLTNPADVALSTSLWTLLRTFGGVFGVALGGTLVQNSLSHANASQYAQNIQGIAELPLDLKAPVLKAFVLGLQRFFILLAVLSGIAFLASFLIKKVALDGGHDNKQDEGHVEDRGNGQEMDDVGARRRIEKLDDASSTLSNI
ncbi:hypothetical protein FBU30_002683 [Linnemannia zychae]|nr:hypothetical protein FBU30_002683 [Linnemannia zychae]